MNRRTVIVAVAAVAVIAGYLYWASDERQIRRLLDGVADAVAGDRRAGGRLDRRADARCADRAREA